MRRLHAIRQARMNPQGLAGICDFEFTDGSTETIEIVRGDMRELLMALHAVCVALGERSPTTQPITATGPTDGVLVPTEEWSTVKLPSGSVWLVFRVGSVDLRFALPDPTAARALGEALVAASRSVPPRT